jgi:hypothetical protein
MLARATALLALAAAVEGAPSPVPDPVLDCKLRRVLADVAAARVPWMEPSRVTDALRLSECPSDSASGAGAASASASANAIRPRNAGTAGASDLWEQLPLVGDNGAVVIYADGDAGNDTNDGLTPSRAVRTLTAARNLARLARKAAANTGTSTSTTANTTNNTGGGGGVTVALRGTFYLAEPLVLDDSSDGSVTWRGPAVISGGFPLSDLAWSPAGRGFPSAVVEATLPVGVPTTGVCVVLSRRLSVRVRVSVSLPCLCHCLCHCLCLYLGGCHCLSFFLILSTSLCLCVCLCLSLSLSFSRFLFLSLSLSLSLSLFLFRSFPFSHSHSLAMLTTTAPLLPCVCLFCVCLPCFFAVCLVGLPCAFARLCACVCVCTACVCARARACVCMCARVCVLTSYALFDGTTGRRLTSAREPNGDAETMMQPTGWALALGNMNGSLTPPGDFTHVEVDKPGRNSSVFPVFGRDHDPRAAPDGYVW